MHLSFVLLPAPIHLDGAAMTRTHAGLFPTVAPPMASTSAESVNVLYGGSASTHISLVPGTIRSGEVEAASRASISAFSQVAPAGEHVAHLVVITYAAREDKNTLVAHTRVVAACASAFHAVGVYEPNARATHPTQFYVSVATSTPLPLLLWTGVSVAGQPGNRMGVLSHGAARMLDVPDMLVFSQQGDDDPVTLLFDMLAFVLDRGEPFFEGESVGRTADEAMRVRYIPSPMDPKQRVACLEMPTSPRLSSLEWSGSS